MSGLEPPYQTHLRSVGIEPVPESAEVVADPPWHPLKRIVLDARASGSSINGACAAAGLSTSTLYAWRQRDYRFAQAWADACVARGDWYEDQLRDQAAKGNTVAIIVGLKMTGRFADNPAMLIQQDNRQMQVDLSGMSLDDLRGLRQALEEPSEMTAME